MKKMDILAITNLMQMDIVVKEGSLKMIEFISNVFLLGVQLSISFAPYMKNEYGGNRK